MAREADSALQLKILQVGFVLAFTAAILYAVRGMMFGSYRTTKLVAGAILALAGLLAADKNYILICPVLSMYPLKIPGTPFNGAELGAILCVGVCFVRLALRKDRLSSFRPQALLALPYFAWVAIAYIQNPVGFAMFGATSIGARYYFDIFLGFILLFTFSRFSLTEKQCKILFFCLFAMSFFQVYTTWRYMRGGGEMGELELLLGNRAQKYYLDPVVFAVLLLLCRHSLSDILSTPWRFVFIGCLTGLVVYSGRRTYTGYAFLAPFFLMFLRGRERVVTLLCAGIGLAFLLLVAAGQGRVYNLPRSIQRALSPLPGRWNVEFENLGMRDLFRDEMKRRAKEEIKESPIFGHGGLRLEYEEAVWTNARAAASRSTGLNSMEYSRNWHNKFWGMSADFGLPAGLFWYLFSIGAGLFAWKHRFFARSGDYRSALILYYSLMLFYDLVFTMGGSASTPFLRWPQFSYLLALLNPLPDRQNRPLGPSDFEALPA